MFEHSQSPVKSEYGPFGAMHSSAVAQPLPSRNSLILDLDGMVLQATPAALEALELSEAAVVGRSVTALLEKPRASRLKLLLERALKGAPAHCVARLSGARGPAASVDLRIRLDVSGANCALEAVWEPRNGSKRFSLARPEADLPRRQAAFEMLFQAYLELQEINKKKTAMVAAATHELKTPLAVISGACELLLSGKLSPLTEPQREIVALSHQNCGRLLNVVNSFLDYSAVEHGKLALRLESHSISELLSEGAGYWKRLAQSRGIGFDCLAPDSLPKVVCDRAKIQNVLNSLCDNALKFTPAGGQVTMAADLHFWDRRLATVRIPEERREIIRQKPNAVRFSLSDTGPGIPPEFHQEIFEEYFQVTGSPAGGMGLGLAIARKIVAAHKGKIWVESQPGSGSSFHFVLPF